MEFIHPEILWGLGALAIPLAIHLLHFRRFKRVEFTAVSLLEEVAVQTRSNRRLRHLLILLLRLLAIAGVIFAFAQPFTPAENGSGHLAENGQVTIYLDNSPSMESVGASGELLAVARARAGDIIESYPETTRFRLLTNAFSGRDERDLTQAAALERLAEVEVGPLQKNWAEIARRSAGDGRRGETGGRVFLFTDLQSSAFSLDPEARPDTNQHWVVVPSIPEVHTNLWVDSAWFDRPLQLAGQPAVLHVRVAHDAKSEVRGLPLRLFVDDLPVALGGADLMPGSATDTTLHFTLGEAGPHAAKIEIEDVPVVFDDRWHFGFQCQQSVRITSFEPGEQSRAIERIFATAEDQFTWSTTDQLNEASLNGADIVIVDAETEGPSSAQRAILHSYAEAGGTVVWLANGKSGLGPMSEGPISVSKVATEDPLFRGVFSALPELWELPEVQRYHPDLAPSSSAPLLTLANGHALLSHAVRGAGQCYYFSAPLTVANSNFLRHALAVPTWLRMGETARNADIVHGRPGDGEPWRIEVLTDDARGRWRVEFVGDTTEAWEPAARRAERKTVLSMGGLATRPGLYRLSQTTADGDSLLAYYGLNHNPEESDLAVWDPEDFKRKLADLGWGNVEIWAEMDEQSGLLAAITDLEHGQPWWKACVILALLALSLEVILLRIWQRKSS